MARKTNKTSHVLNLLTNGAPEEAGEQSVQETGQKESGGTVTAEGQKAAPENKVIVVNETSENEKLSNEIRNRLEAQLEAEEAQAAKEAPAQTPVKEAEAVLKEKEEPVSEAPAEAPVSEEPEKEEHTYRMLNVMETILEGTDLEGQMKQYGVCTCSRCNADVRALVLTRLPAKYVIVDNIAASPMIGYTENKYRTQIFTEIMKACITVKEHPRH